MKILLAYQSGLPHRNDPYISLVPTGLCYLHSSLIETGHDSILANFSAWSTKRVKQELLKFNPDFIGISQWTHNRHSSLELARTCRNILPNSTIIMGGGHATFCYEDILFENSPVNIVVIGEGETTLIELVSQSQSESEWHGINGLAFRCGKDLVITPPRKNLDDLDRMPIPSLYFDKSVGLDIEMQSEFIVTTRGCPSSCYFCSSPDFWGRRVRFRSPAKIVEEILYIRKKFGLIYFSIRDDTFTADRNRVLEFCRLLQKRDVNILWNCQSRVTAIDEELVIEMKRAGCECIQLGIESGSQRILQHLGKKISTVEILDACTIIKEIGINLSIYLISDVPGETSEDLLKTVELVRQIHPDDGYVSPLAYYPGTKLYKDAVISGAVSSRIFADSNKTALYAAPKPGRLANQLLEELTNNQQSNSERFELQKKLLGYCYTTNIIAGEWYRQRGEFDKAEKELKEITNRQPGNPWGWLLLGDLHTELGRIKKGRECYAEVLGIVPEHGPSKRAIQLK